MSLPTNPSTGQKRRIPRRLVLLAIAALLVAVWFLHPPVVEKAARYFLDREAARAGLQLEIGEIQSHLARPLVARNIRIRAKDTRQSRTAAEIDRVVITLNWPWKAFFGEKRLVRFAAVENVRGVFDFEPRRAAKAAETPTAKTAASSGEKSSPLAYFPETVRVRNATFEILAAAQQSYFVEGLSAEFSEEALGTFSAVSAEIHAGAFAESFGALKGITAWKKGSLYLADLPLRDGIRVDNFQMDLAKPGQFSTTVEAEVFGGAARGDFVLGGQEAPASVSVWAAGTQLKPLVKLAGLGSEADGVLREAKFTFRGDPARSLDGQASLRLSADGFRWKGRGWESLQVGASLSGRRLSLSDFTFRQKENAVSLNGDIALPGKWQDLPKAPFLLNISASVQNLGALAGLLGKPFDEMSGRMSLSSSMSGRLGAVNGFLSAEGSGMGFRDRPIESGRLEVTVVNSEAQVSQCELWSGRDYVRGKGSVQLTPPHQYSGEIQARVEDVAAYLGLLRTQKILPIQEGIAQIRWQGDGTAVAHSGAFQISLDKFVSSLTPSGLTGRFAGTYSPQNIYFSGFELEQGQLRFSTRATLAASGVKLQDSVLLARGREIADAEVFLPLDPFVLVAGKSLDHAVLPDKPLYANVGTRGALGVRDLLKLAGNDLAATGTLRLNLQASGNPASPVIEGRLEGRGLGLEVESGTIPPSQIDASIRAAEGMAKANAEWKMPGNSPATVSLETPLAFHTDNAKVSWWNPGDRISARIALPKFDLGSIKPLFPKVHVLDGNLSGEVNVAGTASKPVFQGELSLAGGSVQDGPKSPLIKGIAGTAKVEADAVVRIGLTGTSGGPFAAQGEISLADLSNPACKVSITGTKVLLADEPGLRVPANLDLEGSGNLQVGSLWGSVRFTEANLSKRLEVTPVLLANSPKSEAPLTAPSASAAWNPISHWALDVALKNDSRFSLGGELSTGEIVPDLRLVGTLGRPVPAGKISLIEARAYFPFTTVMIPEGTLTYFENAPWNPQVDIRGSAQALEYQVQAYAFGALNERRLILRSDPALPQADLVAMLATGIAPGVLSGPNTALALKPFARQLEGAGDVEKVQITPSTPDQSSSRSRLQLWQGLSLGVEHQGVNPLGPRLTYTFRLN